MSTCVSVYVNLLYDVIHCLYIVLQGPRVKQPLVEGDTLLK